MLLLNAHLIGSIKECMLHCVHHNSTLIMKLYIPSGEYPNCLHTTAASSESHVSAQTVPHVLL